MSKKYVNTMNKIHAPQEQLDIALKNIYAADHIGKVMEVKPKKRFHYKAVSGIAAALVAVMLFGAFAFNHGGKQGNSFTITANAAEIRKAAFTNLGVLEHNGGGGGFAYTDNRINECDLEESMEFPIICEGENIETITYQFNGNGYFNIKSTDEGIIKKVYLSDDDALSALYSDDLNELVNSYTIDGGAQKQTRVVLIFKRSETGGKYCERISNDMVYDEKAGYLLPEDLDIYFYDMFKESNNDSIDITVTFTDGTTETATIVFDLKAIPSSLIDEDTGEVVPVTKLEMEARLA